MHRRVVLLVEDHADTSVAITMLLKVKGYVTLCAADGQEAVGELERGARPCLILLDMMMPRMSGEEFRQIQRANPEWADIPVALLTGDGHAEEKARRLGLAAWLRKPVAAEALLDLVRGFCDGSTPTSPPR
jgi:CheY-like chemotaxis protein